VPVFGGDIFQTPLDKVLSELEQAGKLVCGRKLGSKLKEYTVNTTQYGFETLNPFHVEFYLCIPPAQWGVEVVIRTGPGDEADHFSRWCVTNRCKGGALPDGFRVRHLAIWSADQLDSRGEPLRYEDPLEMPTELDFLKFLNVGWIEPRDRHARWGR